MIDFREKVFLHSFYPEKNHAKLLVDPFQYLMTPLKHSWNKNSEEENDELQNANIGEVLLTGATN